MTLKKDVAGSGPGPQKSLHDRLAEQVGTAEADAIMQEIESLKASGLSGPELEAAVQAKLKGRVSPERLAMMYYG